MGRFLIGLLFAGMITIGIAWAGQELRLFPKFFDGVLGVGKFMMGAAMILWLLLTIVYSMNTAHIVYP